MVGSPKDDRVSAQVGSDALVSDEDARAEIAHLFADDRFASTDRRKSMLRFIVEEKLAGREASLKGVTIAQAVFGRGADFDQQNDSIVRIEARRLRQDLDLYYSGPGRDNPVRISIPKGRYVPVFAKQTEVADASVSIRSFIASQLGSWRAAGVTAFLLVATTFFAVAFAERDSDQLVRAPSITILPFESTTDSEAARHVANGMTYELIADLAEFPSFRLYTPSSSEASKDGIVTDYVLSGATNMSTESVRLVASLTKGGSGEVVWGQTYNEELSTRSLMDIQASVAGHIASTIAPTDGILHKRLAAREVGDRFEPSLPAYNCLLQAYEYRRSANTREFEPVKACLLDAVEREPKYAEAWALLAWFQFDQGRFRLGKRDDWSSAIEKALISASKSLALEPENVQATKVLGAIQYYRGKFSESWRLLRKALAINPNDPNTLFQLGWRLALRGHLEEGIPLVEEAIARSVRPRSGYYRMLAVNHLLNGEFEEMLLTAELSNSPNNGKSLALLAIAHSKSNNRTAAQQALAQMELVDPHFARDPEAYYRSHRATEEIYNAVVDGLKDAGWQPPQRVANAPGL